MDIWGLIDVEDRLPIQAVRDLCKPGDTYDALEKWARVLELSQDDCLFILSQEGKKPVGNLEHYVISLAAWGKLKRMLDILAG